MKLFKDKKAIMFDLDGTVIDSKEGIFNAIHYTFNKLGMKEEDESVLNKFIGPSIGASFMRLYGFSEEDANNAVKIYREYYGSKGVLECKPYEGLEQLLIKLKAEGKKLGIATKKPDMYAQQIITNLGFDKYFDVVCGSHPSENHDSKAHIIEQCVAILCGDKDNAIMIGDTKYDVIGSNEAKVDCIGVLYGYGSLKELQAENATAIAEDMNGLTELLI